LEFLGDAVLEYVVSKELFQKFPDKEEGYLTALRANLVNTVNLASVAKKMQIGDVILLSKGEEDTGGRTNPSLLANTVEALIGALYLDSGLPVVEDFIKEIILDKLDDALKKPLKDAKSMLQELAQSKGYPAPTYNVIKEDGPDHAKNFVIEVYINGKPEAKGTGKSKSEAEQSAAHKALKRYL
jgi:ribonuclease-3